MAKKITDNTPIQNFEDPWGGTYQSGANAGKEWGKTRSEVERVIKEKVEKIEGNIDGIILDSVTGWTKIASFSATTNTTEINGMSRNSNLIVDGGAFATQSIRDVFYFMAEENAAYKFEVAKANATSVKTIGLSDDVPADGVSISKVLATASTAAFTVYAVADRAAYIFLALQRDAGTTVNVYKGITMADKFKNEKYLTAAPQALTDTEKSNARDNIEAAGKSEITELVRDNVVDWEQIADYGITASGATGMSRNSNLIVDGGAFATQSIRDVFYFMAEENAVYKFEVAKANATSVKTIGLSDDVPADGVSISKVLATASTAAFTAYAVADKAAYIFIAVRRDSGTTVKVSKGITVADKFKNEKYLTAAPQALTDTEKSNARDNIEAAGKSEITELVKDNIVDWEKITHTGKTLIVSGDTFETNANRNVYYFPIQQRSFYKFEVTNANSATITIGLADEVPAEGSAIAKKLEQFKGVTFTKYAMAENNAYMFIALQRNASFAISIYRGITLAESMNESKYVTCAPQLLTDNEKKNARSNIGALGTDVILDNVTEWTKIASYSSAGTSGMSNNGNLIVSGDVFVTKSTRNVFYFLAEKNAAYKFEVTNANETSVKTIGIADEVPADGVSISQILATASTAAFTAYAVADKAAYIFLALQRDAGTTVNVYKGTTAFQQIRENSFVNTTPQNLTEEQKRTARENINAASEGGSSIKILYIGNSLTQDSVAYLPALLDEIAPNINYQFYDWFVGAYTLDDHYTKFLNGGTAVNFSVSSRKGAWTHFNGSNAVTIDQVLQNYEFDVLVLMDYFNGAAATDNVEPFNNVISYIREHYHKPFMVATLLHPPMKADTATYKTSVYNKTVNVNKLILQQTEAMSVIDVGAAMVTAFGTELDALGKNGHLRYDPVHAQDGLPCLMQAYVQAMWIFRMLGLPYGIVNSQLRITQQIHDAINVPGPHSDSEYPPIEGTDEQHAIAQLCAIKADKIGRKLEMDALNDM